MDGAAAGDRYPTANAIYEPLACRRANALRQSHDEGRGEAACCADLGGSSNYSTANFED